MADEKDPERDDIDDDELDEEEEHDDADDSGADEDDDADDDDFDEDDDDDFDEDDDDDDSDEDDGDDSDEDDDDDSDEDDDDDSDEDDDDDSDDDDDDDDDDSDEDDDDDSDEDDDDDSDEDDDDDSDDDDDDSDEEDDEEDDEDRAADVAAALGVGKGAKKAGKDDEEKPEKVNRSERRRQRALRRRKGRAGAASDDPQDRNKRRREQLLKRRRKAAQASDEDEADPVAGGLMPSEMVDDALARGGQATINWVRNNWKVLQWVLTAVIIGGAGAIAYVYFSTKTSEDASDILAAAVNAEEATIIKPEDDKRDEEQKKGDLRNIFASEEERQTKALDSYRAVAAEHGDSAAGILAKLGEGGLLLDKRDWDGAIGAFDNVLATQLATVDKDVKLRALEGKGFAQEGKKDLDGALATFEKIAELGGDAHKVLSLYHQGRVFAAKGQNDQAKTKLQEARAAAEKAKLDTKLVSTAHPYRWLEQAIVEELTAVDPSTAPLTRPGANQLPPGKLQELLQQKGFPGGLPVSPGGTP